MLVRWFFHMDYFFISIEKKRRSLKSWAVIYVRSEGAEIERAVEWVKRTNERGYCRIIPLTRVKRGLVVLSALSYIFLTDKDERDASFFFWMQEFQFIQNQIGQFPVMDVVSAIVTCYSWSVFGFWKHSFIGVLWGPTVYPL